MDSLRDRSYQEKRAGKIGSMSAMVREAIDAYLKKTPERSFVPERPNARFAER